MLSIFFRKQIYDCLDNYLCKCSQKIKKIVRILKLHKEILDFFATYLFFMNFRFSGHIHYLTLTKHMANKHKQHMGHTLCYTILKNLRKK